MIVLVGACEVGTTRADTATFAKQCQAEKNKKISVRFEPTQNDAAFVSTVGADGGRRCVSAVVEPLSRIRTPVDDNSMPAAKHENVATKRNQHESISTVQHVDCTLRDVE